jgi:hypothetical protein
MYNRPQRKRIDPGRLAIDWDQQSQSGVEIHELTAKHFDLQCDPE